MMTLVGIMFVLGVLVIWRRLHQHKAQLVFKYKLYALRDELRMLAFEEKVDRTGFIFGYFDNSLSKAISESYFITLFRIIFLTVRHDGDEELKKFGQRVDAEVAKNKDLQKLYARYVESVKAYVFEQHFVSGTLFVKPLVSLVLGTKWAARRFNRWTKSVFIFPETSASDEYTFGAV